MSSKVATEAAASTPPAGTPAQGGGIKNLLRGDLGQFPVLLTLVIIAVFFDVTTQGLFLSPRNLTYLVTQIITIGIIGLAAALVLLIGEIDLSLGAVAYATANITVVLSVARGWPAWPALGLGLVAGIVIGAINGFFVAIVRVPSFIVTLAGLLFYTGVALFVLEPQTDLQFSNPTLVGLANNYVPSYLGIGLPVLAVVIYGAALFANRAARLRMGLQAPPMWSTILNLAITSVVVIAVVAVLESYLGVPVSAMILIGMILLLWLVMRFTAFGRHVYAVGGNAEASRRAGISVTGVRITIFVLASSIAFVGGILSASRLGSGIAQVDQTLLLNAIAAAVIGGVSLFGGRGSVWSVVLGAVVLGSIVNGLTLLDPTAEWLFEMVEGAVLLVAVTADALARRRSAVSGR